jgi:hypothetical protein
VLAIMSPEHGLDLLSVEARITTPQLETACEICLREADRGRRVGFAFLDVAVIHSHPRKDYVMRMHKRKRVRALEKILEDRGVTVIRLDDNWVEPPIPTSAQLGIHSIESLRDYRLDGAALGLGALSSLISFLNDTLPDISEHRELVDRLIASSHRAYFRTLELIRRHRPANVLVFNGRLAYTKGIAEAARVSGIPTLYHEISSTYERYYLERETVHNQSHSRTLLRQAWSQAGDDRAEVGEKFFSRDRASVLHLHAPFLEAQQVGRTLAKSNRRRIVYFASSVDEFAALDDGLKPVIFNTQAELLIWLSNWVKARNDYELVIRLHPRMTNLAPREVQRWRALECSNVMLLPADSGIDSYALVESADRIAVFHSTVGIEASYLGKVSILLGDSVYRGLDCVYEPESTDELERILLDHSLPPKPRENCLPYGYWLLTRGEPYRHYAPTSYQQGKFAGHQLPAQRALPLAIDIAVQARTAMRQLPGRISRSLGELRR